MVYCYISNMLILREKNSTHKLIQVFCVDYYGCGKSRLGVEFVNQIEGVPVNSAWKMDEEKKRIVVEELNLLKSCKSVVINDCYSKSNFRERNEMICKLADVGSGEGEKKNLFLILDEIPYYGNENEFSNFRRYLNFDLIPRAFKNGHRIHVYFCGRSELLATVSYQVFSPYSRLQCWDSTVGHIEYVQLQPLLEDDVDYILADFSDRFEKNLPLESGEFRRFAKLLVEECGVVPRLLERILQILVNQLPSGLKNIQRGDEESSENFVERFAWKVLDILFNDRNVLRDQSSVLSPFDHLGPANEILLHFCRFRVCITDGMLRYVYPLKNSKNGEKKRYSLEHMINLTFFYLSKEDGTGTKKILLPNLYRRILAKLARENYRGRRANKRVPSLRFHFLLGSGEYLEYVVGMRCMTFSIHDRGNEKWSDVFGIPQQDISRYASLEKLWSMKTLAESSLDIPKISSRGRKESVLSLQTLQNFCTLHPSNAPDLFGLLQKEYRNIGEGGVVILLPGGQSKSSDLYLLYGKEKMLLGLACKDYQSKSKFGETELKDELDKIIPSSIGVGAKRSSLGMDHVVLMVVCTSGHSFKDGDTVSRTKERKKKVPLMSDLVLTDIGNETVAGSCLVSHGPSYWNGVDDDKEDVFRVTVVILSRKHVETFLTVEELTRLGDFRKKRKNGRAANFVHNLVEVQFGDGSEMKDETRETKEFNVFSFIKETKAAVHLEKKKISQNALLQHFFLECGGRLSPKKKRVKKMEMKDEEDEEEGEFPWDEYSIYDQHFTLLPSFAAVWKKQDGSYLYFLTDEEKQRKVEEEEEARKRKEEVVINDLGTTKVRIYFVEDEDSSVVFSNVEMKEHMEKGYEETKKSILEGKDKIKNQRKEVGTDGLEFYFYNSWKKEKAVGLKMVNSVFPEEDFGAFLCEKKICFLVSKEERGKINKRDDGIDISELKEFRGGSGMSFLDKWFGDEEDDKDDEAGRISVSTEEGRDGEWTWKDKVVDLKCSDGKVVLCNIGQLIETSSFFRKMINFGGTEVEEARAFGRINIAALSSFEMEYYLRVLAGQNEEGIFAYGNSLGVDEDLDEVMEHLFRLLVFGLEFKDRVFTEVILMELERTILPSLFGHEEIRSVREKLWVHLSGRIETNLIEVLVERWCLKIYQSDGIKDLMVDEEEELEFDNGDLYKQKRKWKDEAVFPPRQKFRKLM